MDLLLAKQEAGQVASTKEALIADVLLEGTASASGRLPVKQASRSDVDVVESTNVEKGTARDKAGAPDTTSTAGEKSVQGTERQPKEARVPDEQRR
jgi:hypothetical protein